MPSHAFQLRYTIHVTVRTPQVFLPTVWPPPRSLATTSGISVDVFSWPYLDVSVQAVPHVHLWIQCTLMRYCRTGFPHSEISGSKLMCSSPKLFAACHVLHRLLMPRHSPCALISLTFVRRNFISSPSAQARSSIHSVPSSSQKHATACFCILIISGSQNYAGFRRILTLVSIVVFTL